MHKRHSRGLAYLYEKSDLSIYEVGKKALEHGVISAYFATNLVSEVSFGDDDDEEESAE